MKMGKLTAKLRDAVPVCFLVEDMVVKRYKNIEIPDENKNLEYQDIKFDEPMNGSITFKIMFEPGILPEKFPQTRERKIRADKEAPVAKVNEAPVATAVEGPSEATQDTTAIIIHGGLVEAEPENTSHIAGNEVVSPVEDQV